MQTPSASGIVRNIKEFHGEVFRDFNLSPFFTMMNFGLETLGKLLEAPLNQMLVVKLAV